ncbi:MAG: cupin domain-containing protein [Phototrophicales bacterium]|nr:MAG: cupin domain-containing protein [Phototrophicales bacterium]
MTNHIHPKPHLLQNTEGRALWHLGALLNFKALGEETNGQFWALVGLADNNMAIPLHAHSHEEEIWYVLEGEIHFTVGEETIVGKAGTFAYIPRNVPHTFNVVSDTARWFGIGIPAGLDQWFFETGEPANALTLPPPSIIPPNVEEIVASLKAYGTETLGPPPSTRENM